MSDDPVAMFISWLDQARRHTGIIEPEAACLATAGTDGQPSARMVLVKEADARGFTFYTNLGSRKAEDLRENPRAALCFYWMPLRRQVRIEGRVEPVSDAEADAYFSRRPRQSRLGAWASKQSQPMESPEALKQALAAMTVRFEGQDVPRPDFWSGWRLMPDRIEFWEEGEFRLHRRRRYTREGQSWEVKTLYP